MSLPAPPDEPDAAGGFSPDADLRRREEYFRALAEQSLDIIGVLDAGAIIRFESPSLERWTGWKPEELVGRSAFELIHPDDLARITEVFSYGIASPTGIELVEYRFRGKDGGWRVLESWGKNLLSNEFVRGIVIYTRDITERREEEHRRLALSNLMTRLNTAETMDAAGSMIAVVTDELFGWDAFSFNLYLGKQNAIRHVLNIDTINGQRVEVEPAFQTPPPGSITHRVIEEGARLIFRESAEAVDKGAVLFGDTSKRSASIMAVPVNGPHGVLAVLAIHSY
ncbi:MAG TPA: PAS domain S-box protein, partial [Candidatus Acidoferrum sp.]|nr:PAS domain S-box protein [Candidatus Acidoferrum sp.]